ncbi:brassinosteroid-responsive RING protein 1-like [Miscanthus floridulus]|uniref:brassinosteroid-responsive RING protein 1-like n=1 Tax=Miscanthus floridulus TaxID=154761 RepID=UPI003458C8C0
MGFPSVCYCVILPQPLILVLQLLDFLRHAVLLCLSSLGLAAPPATDDHPAYAAPPPADLWALQPSSSLLLQAPAVAAPPHLLAPPTPAAIKARLPAVRYADLLRSRRAASPAVCAVCLGALEARHRVRELGNCAHAFHKACIDKWVDKGQATCPLCRALLLPDPSSAGDGELASSPFSF